MMASILVDSHSTQKHKTVRPRRYESRPDAPDHGRYVSKEEYWGKWYEGTKYEWNNGYLEAKPMPKPKQFDLFSWFLLLLLEFRKNTQSIQVMGLETGFSMEIPDPDNPGQKKETTRKPDIGAILLTNPVLWGEEDRSYEGICDLCVEVTSDSKPSEIRRDTQTKFAEYQFAGVQEYYILDADNREMNFYTRNTYGLYEDILPDAEGVIHSKVLHGFQFRQSDLMTKPSMEELALDPVYQKYVMVEYQAMKAKAERMAQALRDAGIDPEDLD